MKTIDLNSDVGEGLNNEVHLMPYLSSCNIACGMHAGDEETMRRIVELALQKKVSIGAHPSYDDRANFGRKELDIEEEKLKDLIQNQVWQMIQICQEFGAEMKHVKPHGALYNQAAKSIEISTTIVKALTEIRANIKLFGLAESQTAEAAKGKLPFVAEGFVDRKYATKNELMARAKGGLIENTDEIRDQVFQLLKDRSIRTAYGLKQLHVETICLHGDTPNADQNIVKIHQTILDLDYEISSPI